MEALAGVASGRAVTSLTIQLVDSISKIKTFVDNVKDAPKELKRLVEKLQLLSALLEEVRKILEAQASGQEQHFPPASTVLSQGLQRCEKSIQLLKDIVGRFRMPQSQLGSTVAKLKSEVKLGFKVKEIATVETRIQQDIDYLHMCLTMNSTVILTTLLPVLVREQQIITTKLPLLSNYCNSTTTSAVAASALNAAYPSNPSQSRYSQRTLWVRSPLEKLGLYRRKVIKYRHVASEESENMAQNHQGEIFSETDELLVLSRLLGFGLTLARQHPHSKLFPSLYTYPVVDSFDMDLSQAIYRGSVQDLQRMFASGAAHPHVRNFDGLSLLHYAALFYRPDMYRLLRDHGVKPDPTSAGIMPLTLALNIRGGDESPMKRVDIYRCCLSDLSHLDNLCPGQWWLFPLLVSSEEAHWLWQQNTELFVGESHQDNQRTIIKGAWSSISRKIHMLYFDDIQLPTFPMDVVTLCDIQSGRYRLLESLFYYYNDVASSYCIGTFFLDWLIGLDIDPEACVCNELAFSGETIFSLYRPERRIIFQRTGERKWRLGWEWVFDRQAPAYALVSEYTSLTVEVWNPGGWPLIPWKDQANQDEAIDSSRFERREEAKRRKERVRAGLKRPRSRMPGAWTA